MKKKIIFLISLVVVGLSSFTQNTAKKTKHAPLDFSKSMWNISANTKGRIQAETWYKDVGNNAGNARVYLIHKAGGNWWYQEAKKRFPEKAYPQDWLLEKIELKEKEELKNYNKWAFFVDKKYLAGQPSYGTDFYQTDENGNKYLPSEEEIKKIQEELEYYEKSNTSIEVILYEQKAGSNEWAEIDRKKFKTNEEGYRIYPKDPKTGKEESWEGDFIDQKLKESNESAFNKQTKSYWNMIKGWWE